MMCHINNMYELRTLCTQKDKTKESPKALKKKNNTREELVHPRSRGGERR